jgi:bifunctional N-acetylglucosamine-1-phosphate-uridyltransferase/glucosamine-1-phosphate-acetyltransferase GlmU-like protein
VGAGSTVTKSVPSGSLAVERAKLRMICDGFRAYWEKKGGLR